jgi:type I restriction-modification system DNA methylase subunit
VAEGHRVGTRSALNRSRDTIRRVAGLFGRNRLRQLASEVPTDLVKDKLEIVRAWHRDYHEGSLKKDKETSREQAFNQDFFVKILGHIEKPSSPYTFEPKATTVLKQLPDALISYTDASKSIQAVSAVVELKGASTPLDRPQQREGNFSPVQQAFKYKTQYRVCPFVIVSNFFETRLYADHLLDYERWTLDDLVDPQDDYVKFKTFYLLLRRENFTSPSGKFQTETILSDIRSEQEEIGKEFYKVYKLARLELLRDIYRKNPHVRNNFEVGIEKAQKIIDRVVFCCFAEDRGLLPDDTVARVVDEADNSSFGNSLWSTFKSFFQALDKGSTKLGIPAGYNGGLFAGDPVLNQLNITDESIRRVAELSKHDFVEKLSVNILGHIFEQSISDLEEIREKAASKDRVEKIDGQARAIGRRKKEGVYYTPDFVIRYIVENSLGSYLRLREEELKVKHRLKGDITDVNYAKRERAAYEEYLTVLQEVTVCDPACGSGAFLAAVFDYLLAENQRVDDILGGSLLSLSDYVRTILRNNVYGVDLNEESVQITKLSLWLKTAEKNKKLTTLDKNIRCGNSLVADDSNLPHAFSWENAFPEIFKRGGFDVIVGNPPYVRVQNLDHDITDYLFENYKTPTGKLDISIVFFERSLELLRDGGRLAFISSSQWMQTNYGKQLRGLLSSGHLEEIIDFGSLPVFEGASTYPAIFTIRRNQNGDTSYGRVASVEEFSDTSLRALGRTPVNLSKFGADAWQFSELNLMSTIESSGLSWFPLTSIGTAYYGNITGLDDAFVLTRERARELELEEELLLPYALRGAEVTRFRDVFPENVVIYPYRQSSDGIAVLLDEDTLRERYPRAYGYLLSFKEKLGARKDSRKLYASGSEWFKHVRPGSFNLTNPNKLLVKGIDKRPRVGLLAGPSNFNGANCPGVVIESGEVSLHYLLAILNSKVVAYYLNSIAPPKLGNSYRYSTTNLNTIPLVGVSDEQIEQESKGILSQNELLRGKSSQFLTLISSEYGFRKRPDEMEWWRTEFNDFCRLLEKKLNLSEKNELLPVWQSYVQACRDYDKEIGALDAAIQHRTYELYKLSDVEASIIESSIP